jgi:hypothetical protein
MMFMVIDKNIYPLPEAVDSKKERHWKIQPSQRLTPRVYLKHSLLMVPLGSSPQDRMTRNHELGHIRWSPPKPHMAAVRHKVDLDVLQAAEDMRINTMLGSIGVDTSSGTIGEGTIKAFADDLLKSGSVRNMILMMVAVIGHGANEDVFRDKFGRSQAVSTTRPRSGSESRAAQTPETTPFESRSAAPARPSNSRTPLAARSRS